MLLSILAVLPVAALALPTPLTSRTIGTAHSNKVISQDFADPSLLQDGNEWYAFATNNHKSLGNASAIGSGSLINVQIAHSPDFVSWTVSGTDALPEVGAWVEPNGNAWNAAVWAPKVIKNNLGQYVLHYSAAVAGNPSKHCIGTATATTPTGPYQAQATPLACPTSAGGAIDSSPFIDSDGSIYVVYKVDGNSIGHGGSCGNTVAPIVATPILLQRLSVDGLTHIGLPVQILDRSAGDGPLIEAPSLTRTSGGQYVLFFSSNCYATSLYDVSYAFSNAIGGPYIKAGPMMVTGTDGLYSPGGADVDGTHMVFHAGDVGPQNVWPRAMYTAIITIDATAMVVSS